MHGGYLASLTLLPMLAFGLFAALFSKGEAERLPIAVLDDDHTLLSRRLTAVAGDVAELRYEVQSADEGLALIRRGEVDALLCIPSAFERNLLGQHQTTVGIYNSGANLSANGLITRDLQSAITTFAVGAQLQRFEQQGLSRTEALAMARPITFSQHALFNPWLNYAYYLAPCFMAMMLMIFTVMSTSYAIGSELKGATAPSWLRVAGGSLTTAIAGKMTLITALLVLLAAAMFTTLFGIVDLPMRGSGALIAVATILFILSYEAVAIFIVAITANLRLALSLGGGYSVLAFTFSGITFPTMAMFPEIQWLTHLFPYTHYMQLLIDQTLRGAPIEYSLEPLAAMLPFLLLPPLAARRLRRVVENAKYWYRC